MKLSERLSERLGNTEPIKGFRVMEWLRGVRDEHYRLSIEDPEAYAKMREKAKKEIRYLAQEEGKEVIRSS